MDVNVATRVAVDSETIRFITTLRVDAAASDARFTHTIAKARTVFIRACLRPRATTGNGPSSVFFLLIGMTAIGATSPFGHGTANGGSPPERTPSAGTNRQILSTRAFAHLDEHGPRPRGRSQTDERCRVDRHGVGKSITADEPGVRPIHDRLPVHRVLASLPFRDPEIGSDKSDGAVFGRLYEFQCRNAVRRA